MTRYKVTSVALHPKTWERVATRTEVVDAGVDIFKHCLNGRAVGEMYEFYWNKLVDDAPAVVRVTGVEEVK